MTRTKPKTFLSMLLALMLVFTALPMSAFAAETDTLLAESETAVVVETEAIDDTSAVVTEEVAETEAPVETEAPTEETTPAETEAPVETESPEETPTPEETDPVGSTEEPVENTDPYSGYIGDSSVAWEFNTSTGQLFITGNGDCDRFWAASDQPWADFRTQITEVWFYDMDTLAISDLSFWFSGCTALKTAEVPYTTPVIGKETFADCESLYRLMVYFMDESFVIENGAFYVDALTPLEVAFIPSSENTMNTLYAYQWADDNRAAYFSDAYGMMVLASGYCSYCKGTYSYSLDYEQWTDDVHCVRHWCSNCGMDQCGGVLGENHTMSGGYCTKCGYGDGSGGGGGGDYDCPHGRYYTEWDECDWYEYCYYCDELMDYGTSHGSTYTEWSGCDWYEYCRDCDELMDYGTSHGSYVYDDWEYYNSSRHRRYYHCSDCGEGSYSYGYHSTSKKYTSYSSTQHQVGNYCSTCGFYVGSTSYESHDFAYGSWTKYSSTQHRRTKTCSDCGYSTYEYASHSMSYGSWTSDGNTQHKRTASCSCGYSTTEYANHAISYGNWKSYSDTQHRRTASCSCGYSSYEYADHTITRGEWKQSSDTEHSRTLSCSCGYTSTESEDHDFTVDAWKSVSDSEHSRNKTCSCGYKTIETEPHELTYGDWTIYSEEQHKRTVGCECGYSTEEYGDHNDADDDGYCDDCSYTMTRFSVTVPASLSLTISKWGEVYAADNAEIVNNSTDAVEITGITLTAENGWTLVPYATNMASAKVDAKQIGFRINNTENVSSGSSESLSIGNGWTIAEGDSLPLDYDATVSATSDPISEQVLTIVFIVDWAV